MNFAWDADKSDINFAERGFDFAFASQIFDGPTLEREDGRQDYGETRLVAVGVAQGITLTVVYTDRLNEAGETTRRVISARRSNRRERETYQERV